MSDTSYWPEVLVDELRNVVRESKFDFIAASEKLSKWWLSNESNVTAADRGMDISGIDKATIEITSASVRVNFARDYKDAPFKTAVVSSVSQETKTISPKATAVQMSAPIRIKTLIRLRIQSLSWQRMMMPSILTQSKGRLTISVTMRILPQEKEKRSLLSLLLALPMN